MGRKPADLVFVSAGGDAVESFDDRFGNALRKKFPNYNIQYVKGKIPELITAGQTMDILWDSIGKTYNTLIQYGLNYDMTELMKAHNVDTSGFEPASIDAMRSMSGGGLYGLPVTADVMVTFYNKDLFDRFGIPYPKNGWTWDEAIDIAKRLTRTDGGMQYYGFSYYIDHLVRMNQLSLPYLDAKAEKATVNNDKWKGFIQTAILSQAEVPGYRDGMIRSLDGKFPGGDQFIKTQEAAIYFYQTNQLFKGMPAFNWDIAPLPVFKEAPGIGSQPYPIYFSVAKGSKYKDQAMEVIKYLTSEEFQMEASKKGLVPVLKSEVVKKAFGQESAFKGKHFEAIFYNKMAPVMTKTPYDDDVENPLKQAILNAALGTADINTALRTAEEEGNKAVLQKKTVK
ncbi:extracellular solute-binding protein [Paenibacillus sp. P25]|nr:extracellular solute-binding protein [Paenibacillus sp. P25]